MATVRVEKLPDGTNNLLITDDAGSGDYRVRISDDPGDPAGSIVRKYTAIINVATFTQTDVTVAKKSSIGVTIPAGAIPVSALFSIPSFLTGDTGIQLGIKWADVAVSLWTTPAPLDSTLRQVVTPVTAAYEYPSSALSLRAELNCSTNVGPVIAAGGIVTVVMYFVV